MILSTYVGGTHQLKKWHTTPKKACTHQKAGKEKVKEYAQASQ
jgi:hypothetical protein